jgi:hypothetical protein
MLERCTEVGVAAVVIAVIDMTAAIAGIAVVDMAADNVVLVGNIVSDLQLAVVIAVTVGNIVSDLQTTENCPFCMQ